MNNGHGLYAQMQLRLSPEFRDYMHTAILHVATAIRNEPDDTPAHEARVAMADKIIETNEPVVGEFIDRIVFRAVMEPTIRDTVFQNGQMALAFTSEEAVVAGVAAIWNETTLAVWPTIMEDTAQGE